MSLLKKKYYTIEDIYALPPGERAELIDGQIHYMAPPTTTHQRIVHFLDWVIGSYIREHNGSCEVFPAPFAVFLEADGGTYVEPDLTVVCDRNKIDDKGCHGAPDWVIEVVSPSSKRMDYYTKLARYKEAGVREYWIIDPDKKCIIIYDLEHEEVPMVCPLDGRVKACVYEDLEIDFSGMKISP